MPGDPEPLPTGPYLALTLTTTTYVGVPTTLTVQAMDAKQQPESRSGTLLLEIPDERAVVPGAERLPTNDGQRVSVRLDNGRVDLPIQFGSAGDYRLFALLAEDREIGGQSAELRVDDVVLELRGPAAASRAQHQRYTILVKNRQGQPIPDYAGTVTFAVDDGAAVAINTTPGHAPDGTALTDADATVPADLEQPGEPSEEAVAEPNIVTHTFIPEDRGQARIDLVFNQPGKRTISVDDIMNPSRRVQQEVTVAASAEATPVDGAAMDSSFTALLSNPYFEVSLKAFNGGAVLSSINAGVQMRLDVQAKNADGTNNTNYTGTVALTSSDALMRIESVTGSSYTFGSGEAGRHEFLVQFYTVSGSGQTITVTDTASAWTGTSLTVTVDVTYFQAVFGAASVREDTPVNLTVTAVNGSGQTLGRYRGAVRLSASYASVLGTGWGTPTSTYRFTVYVDDGVHSFTPSFIHPGEQTVTITDTVVPGRTFTTDPIVVTNAPPDEQYHWGTPGGLKLDDGSYLWANLAVRGDLYVRRNVGTLDEPAWKDPYLVQARLDTPNGEVGADSPTLAQLGSTVALFYTHTDNDATNPYVQIWMVTSTNRGDTWSTPQQLTTEIGHVKRIQAVVSGGTLSLFFSKQNTDRKVFYQTTTNLTAWSSIATLTRRIGPELTEPVVPTDTYAINVTGTSANFAIIKVGSTWVLGFTQAGPLGYDYPVARVVTSTNLTTWTGAVDLSPSQTSGGAETGVDSIALAQDPTSGLIYAAFEQRAATGEDIYIVTRTSTDGISWTTATTEGYERSRPANGSQTFKGYTPTLVAGSMTVGYSGSAGATPGANNGDDYGGASWEDPTSCASTSLAGIGGGEPSMISCGGGTPPTSRPPTEMCNTVGAPVNVITGIRWINAHDLTIGTRGLSLEVCRTYNSYDAVMGRDSAFGIGWNWNYGTRAVTHADGSVSIVESDGRRAIFWKSGSTWTPARNVNDALAARGGGGYILTRQDQTVWEFDGLGRLLSIADVNGNTQTVQYPNGTSLKPSAVVDNTSNRRLNITFTGNYITEVSGPGTAGASTNLVVKYEYAGSQLQYAYAPHYSADTIKPKSEYVYDSRNQMERVIDPEGNVSEQNSFGTKGRVWKQVDGEGNIWKFAFDDSVHDMGQTTTSWSSKASVTDPSNRLHYFYFDADLRLVQRQWQTGSGTERLYFTYDSHGNVATMTRGLLSSGPKTCYTYDTRNNVATTTEDCGTGRLNLTTTYTWDTTNRLIRVVDPLAATAGYDWEYTYTSAGNLWKMIDPLGKETVYTYNAYGQVATVTNPAGDWTEFVYDTTTGDLTKIRQPTATGGGAPVAETEIGYDAAGNVAWIDNPLNQRTSLAVNARGEVTQLSRDESGTPRIKQLTYDLVGNLTEVEDELGNVTQYVYDGRNDLSTVKQFVDATTSYDTSYTYHFTGGVESVTDAENRLTMEYEYDTLGRVTKMKDVVDATTRKTTSYTYDDRGNLVLVTKPDATKNCYVYDLVDRMTGIDLGSSSTTGTNCVRDIQYAYDAAGRRTSMVDSTGTTTYDYFTTDLLKYTDAPDTTGNTQKVEYTYDDAYRVATMTYPSGNVVTNTYTPRGQLLTVDDWLTNGPTTYAYDVAGQTDTITYPNGVVSDYTHDVLNRVDTIVHKLGSTTIDSSDYAYDAASRRIQLIDGWGTTDFEYDRLNRLTEVFYDRTTDQTIAYRYDKVGNRVGTTVNGGTEKLSAYNAQDQLTSFEAAAETFAYDANGNLDTRTIAATNEVETYDFDALDRMSAITSSTSGAVGAYTYNGDGLRTKKVVGGGTNHFTWDVLGLGGLGRVISDGNEHVWGTDLISRSSGTSAPLYIHQDALGSTRLVTNGSGAQAGEIDYGAFGEQRQVSGTTTRFRYTGEQADNESGLTYLRARYVDPAKGRFLSKDPFGGFTGQPMSQHPYSYVMNSAMHWTDPSGLCADDASGATKINLPLGPLPYVPECSAETAAWLGANIAQLLLMGALGGKLGRIERYPYWPPHASKVAKELLRYNRPDDVPGPVDEYWASIVNCAPSNSGGGGTPNGHYDQSYGGGGGFGGGGGSPGMWR